MKIFNKFIWSKTEPHNKNDIWFDGSVFRLYSPGEEKEDAWKPFTIDLETAEKLKNMADDLSSVYQEILIPGEGVIIDDNNNLTLNLKRINGESIIGEGNIVITGGEGYYDDTELRVEIAKLDKDKADKSELEQIATEVSKKVDAEKIATINGKSILEGGNIEIEGGSSASLMKGTGANSVVQTPSSDTFTNKNTILYPEGNYESVQVDAADYAITFNNTTRAGGSQSMAQGHRCVTESEASHVEGHCNVILSVGEGYDGYGSHAEGYSNLVIGNYSHAEGSENFVVGNNAHAEGKRTGIDRGGDFAHTEGYKTFVGDYNSSNAPERPEDPEEGGSTEPSDPGDTPAKGTYGVAAHAEGNYTIAHGHYSHAEGRQATAIGEASHTEGNKTVTNGDYSHAEGNKTTTNNPYSHAEGIETSTNAAASHAEGYLTSTFGEYSHAEGQYTRAHQTGSHSEGNNTDAKGAYSHAEGIGTKTKGDVVGQHVEGYYNKETDSLKVIGCGTSDDDRKNAVEVTQDGRVFVKGIGNYDGTSLEAVDLKTSLDNKANSGDVYNKTEINNIINIELVKKNQVATINGQSLINGGNIVITDGEGGSSVFKAEYGKTTYDEILAEKNKGNVVICNYKEFTYHLTYISNTAAYFVAIYNQYLYQLSFKRDGNWGQGSINTEHSLETLDNGNVQLTIAGQSADVATPQYVENLLGVIINGEY